MLQNSCTPIKFTLIHGNIIIYYIQIWCVIQIIKIKTILYKHLNQILLYDIEDEDFYFLIPLWMQKYVKNEKRYRLINIICILAVYKN